MPKEENSGGLVSYYMCPVPHPKRGGQPYAAECDDIIEALGMNYQDGEVFKSIWRKNAARRFNIVKEGYGITGAKRDAEKMVHYSQRSLAVEERLLSAMTTDRPYDLTK
jgi:hypothetical protein